MIKNKWCFLQFFNNKKVNAIFQTLFDNQFDGLVDYFHETCVLHILVYVQVC